MVSNIITIDLATFSLICNFAIQSHDWSNCFLYADNGIFVVIAICVIHGVVSIQGYIYLASRLEVVVVNVVKDRE